MDCFYWNLPFVVLIVIAKQMVTSQQHARSQCPKGCFASVGVNSTRQFDAFSSNGSILDKNLTCFSVNTTLWYFCTNVYSEQIDPYNYYRKCTPSGWVNIQNDVVFQDNPPNCKKRKPDCFPPNATEGILIQIDRRNIAAEGESTKPLFYLDGTKAIYSCVDPQKKIQIRENNGSDTTKFVISKKCSKGSKKWTLSSKYSEEAELTCVSSNEKDSPTDVTSSSSLSKNDGCRTNGLWYYMLIGGCCLVTLVLIVILIVYRKRLMNISSKKSDVVDGEQTRFSDLGAVVDDLEQSYNTSTRTNPQEHKTQRNGQRAEETLIYENIIPIQVNAEPVYIQVETGNAKQTKKYDKKADGPSNRGKTQASVAARSKVQNDESQTIYAEVQHVKFKNKR